MADGAIDYTVLFRSNLPPAAPRWAGFPKYNFVGGHNDGDSVPVAELIEAASAVLKREGKSLATYNLESGNQGYVRLREFIVKKVKADAAIACTVEDVTVLSGSSQGLNLVNDALVAAGDTVIGEQESYGSAITRVKRIGATYSGIPLDGGGMRMDLLANALSAFKAKGIRPKYIYVIPTVQNPTATVMDVQRREELLRLATDFGVPIFEDECYADLTWSGTRPPALRAMAGDDRVIHLGSFSKSIAPALRLGYLIAGWPVMSRILGCKNDAGSGALEQMVLAEYGNAHFSAHVKRLRTTLKRKLDVLTEALAAEFGTAAEFEQPEGGIFLWVKLPDAVDTMKLFQAAQKEGVAINPGVEWSSNAEHGRSRLRLCFANPSEAVIREGIAKLAAICHREFGVPVRSSNIGR